MPACASRGFKFTRRLWVCLSQFSFISRFRPRKLEWKENPSCVLPQIPSLPHGEMQAQG